MNKDKTTGCCGAAWGHGAEWCDGKDGRRLCPHWPEKSQTTEPTDEELIRFAVDRPDLTKTAVEDATMTGDGAREVWVALDKFYGGTQELLRVVISQPGEYRIRLTERDGKVAFVMQMPMNEKTTDWPRWIKRILFSGAVYPLWGPMALWINKRRNAARRA